MKYLRLKTLGLVWVGIVGVVLFLSQPAHVYPVRYEISSGARRVRGDNNKSSPKAAIKAAISKLGTHPNFWKR